MSSTRNPAAPRQSAADTEFLPMTAAQEGIWFTQSLEPDSPALVTGEYLRIPTDIKVDAFADALLIVAQEAQALGMNVVDRDNVRQLERQSILPFPLIVLDFRGKTDPQAAARRWVEQDAQRPFTPGRGLLFRHALLRVAADEWWWWQCVHHVVIDGYGVALLVRRCAEVYSALCAGRSVSPSPFGCVADLVDEAQDYRRGDQWLTDKAAWQDLVADEIPILADRRALPSRTAHRHEITLGRRIRDALRDQATALGVRWPDLAVAAHAIYVARATRSTQVVLGVPLMNRMGSVAARTPAMAMNVVPFPLQIEPRATIADLAGQVSAVSSRARRHGRYPMADIRRDRRALGEERGVIGPVVNVLPFPYEVSFDGATATAHKVATGAVEDLTCNLIDRCDGALTLQLEANPACYGVEHVAAHAARLAYLIEQVATLDGGTLLSEVEIATRSERDMVLGRFNDTDHQVPYTPLSEPITQQAAQRPTALAVVDEEEQLTFAQLEARVEVVARGLAAHDAGPGTLIAVALPRSVDLIVALLAVLRTGAAYVPLDVDNPVARLHTVIGDAQPQCVLTDASHALAMGDRAVDIGTLVCGQWPQRTWPRSSGEEPAYVIYTSGTTGRPKGVVVSHQAIDNRLRWMQGAYPIGPADTILQKTPIGFDVSVWELFWALRVGARLVMARPGGHRDPRYLRQVMDQQQVTVCHFVPSMLRVFVDHGVNSPPRFLRVVFCSGEALDRTLANDAHRVLPGVRLVNLYGPTEAAVDVTVHEVLPGRGEPVPIGRPIWNTRCYVLDEAGRLCPPGVAGELNLAGTQVANGYLGRPELTAQQFVADVYGPRPGRMYRTGDLVRWNAAGELDYLGRIDDQVKLNGQRLEPGEVQAALLAVSGIREAVVVLREDRPGDQRLVGYVVADDKLGPQSELAEGVHQAAALRSRLASTLPHFMVPSAIVILDALPLTSNGKVNRSALPAPSVDTGYQAPRSPTEAVIVGAFEEALGVEGVGAEANFFDLGGTSLRAAVLAEALSDRLGADVNLGALFRAPSPRALASVVDHGSGSDRSATDLMLPLRVGTTARPPLFVVHPAGGLCWCYSGLLRGLGADQPVVGLQADGLADDSPLPSSMQDLAAAYVGRILEHRPTGPYRLLGWSVGGAIAHTMASQLQELGHEGDLLCLLDAYPSDQWRDQAGPSQADTLRALLRMAGLDNDSDTLEEAGVLQMLRHEGSPLAALPPQVLQRIPKIVHNNAAVMRTARHGTYRGELLIFVAGAPRAEDWLTPQAWQPYVTGDIREVILPCTHPELVLAQQLDRIAQTLDPLLGGET